MLIINKKILIEPPKLKSDWQDRLPIVIRKMTIKERIKVFAKEFAGSEAKFEAEAGLSNGYVSSVGKNIGSEVLSKIMARYPEANVLWLINETGGIKLSPHVAVSVTENIQHQIPEMSGDLGMPKVVVTDTSGDEVIPFIGLKAAAGYLQGYQDPEFIEKQPTIKTPNIKGDGTFRAFEVYGQSMYPTFHHNDIVIGKWEESLDSIRDRRIYILVTKTEGVVVKRLLNRIRESGKIIAISDNDDKLQYGNYTIDPEEILEIWYWKGAIKMEAPEPSRLYARVNNLEAQITLLTEQVSSLLKN